MEKNFSVDRIVGNAPIQEKGRIILEQREIFDSQEFSELVDLERDKTAEEIRVIEEIDGELNADRQARDLPVLHILPKNIHIIPQDKWPNQGNNVNTDGLFDPKFECIMLKENWLSPIGFHHRMYHEMRHMQSFVTLQVDVIPLVEEERRNPITTHRLSLEYHRIGLMICERIIHRNFNTRSYFTEINEGLVEELAMRNTLLHVHDPVHAKEQETTRQALIYLEQHADEFNNILNRIEDIFYLEEYEIASQKNLRGHVFTYQNERLIFNTIIDKLYETNTEKFENREEVFQFFVDVADSESMLPLGRLIEETFGKGAFRRIGREEPIGQKLAFVNSL